MAEEEPDGPQPSQPEPAPSHIGNPWVALAEVQADLDLLKKQFANHLGHAEVFTGQMGDVIDRLHRIEGLLDGDNGNGAEERPNGGQLGIQESADQLDRIEEALVSLLEEIRALRRATLDQ